MRNSKIKTVFFDVGNVLVFPNDQLVKKILKNCGIDIGCRSCTEAYLKADKVLYERGAACEGDIYIKTWGEMLNLDKEAALNAWEKLECIDIWNRLNPDAKQILDYLYGRYSIGIISNTDGNLEKELMSLGLVGYFKTVIDSEVVSIRKPNKAIYELALKKENILPYEACYVCDSLDEIHGAYSCGFGLSVLFDPLLLYGVSPNRYYTQIESLLELRGIL